MHGRNTPTSLTSQNFKQVLILSRFSNPNFVLNLTLIALMKNIFLKDFFFSCNGNGSISLYRLCMERLHQILKQTSWWQYW